MKYIDECGLSDVFSTIVLYVVSAAFNICSASNSNLLFTVVSINFFNACHALLLLAQEVYDMKIFGFYSTLYSSHTSLIGR